MSKRFVDTGKYRQAWRKLDPKLRAAFYWLTENCDAAGYWTVDLDHFKFECGYALDIERLIKETQAVEWHGKKVLRLIDFIETNYGTLKEGYNPHKPALRALAHHKISSLNQASTKLEDEEEDKDEGEDTSGKERARETSKAAATDERFEALWVTFERYGAKGKAFEYWKRLNDADRTAVELKAPAYVKSTPGCEFRKQLEGWINPDNRLWERPIVLRKGVGVQAALHSADVPPDAYQE